MKIAARFAPLRLLGVESAQPRWPTLALTSEQLVIRPPEHGDFAQWSGLRAASRDFLTPWEPPWPVDDLTRSSFRRRMRRYQNEIDSDEAYPFFIFRESDGVLVGGLTLGNVRRGAAQSATLGYWMGARYAGRGFMTAAVRVVCRHAFAKQGIQRIEAACMPENAISLRLLESAGFQREGMARSYLNINGRRRDHILFALLADNGSNGGMPDGAGRPADA